MERRRPLGPALHPTPFLLGRHLREDQHREILAVYKPADVEAQPRTGSGLTDQLLEGLPQGGYGQRARSPHRRPALEPARHLRRELALRRGDGVVRVDATAGKDPDVGHEAVVRGPPPEQHPRADEALTRASDVYALGCTAFELLTGRLPYRLDTRSAPKIMQAVCTQDPARPSEAAARTDEIRGADGKVAKLTPEKVDAILDALE